MGDQLSAQDWVDQGLKALAKSGFTALKAEPLAKAMGVSRGSFYWHFADISAFHAAILKPGARSRPSRSLPASRLPQATKIRLACCCAGCSANGWRSRTRSASGPASIPSARAAVQAIDRRRLGYIEGLMTKSGLSADTARARAQILYWAFLGFAQSDQPLPKAQQAAMLDEMLRIADAR